MFLKTVTTLRAQNGSEGMKKSDADAGYLGDEKGLAENEKEAQKRL